MDSYVNQKIRKLMFENRRIKRENKRLREAIEKVTEKTSYKYRDGNMSYIHNILTEALGVME